MQIQQAVHPRVCEYKQLFFFLQIDICTFLTLHQHPFYRACLHLLFVLLINLLLWLLVVVLRVVINSVV
jgi:hypothetical protein